MTEQSERVQDIFLAMTHEKNAVQGIDSENLTTWLLTGEGMESMAQAINSVLDNYVNREDPH